MAISKVILNEDTLMDVTQDTVATDNMLSGVQATAANGESIVGQIEAKTSSDLTVSGATVTVPAGHYASDASKSVATTTHPKPTASINSSTGVVTASHTQSTGYVTGGTTTGTLSLSTQAAKTVTPTEEEQTAVAAGKYTTGAVTVAAIPSTYVGSGVTQRDETDLTASGATVTVPAGYYAEQETKAVTSGTAGTPSATKGTVSNHSVSVTPSVTNTTGYITGGTKTGTAVTVSASELVSGTLDITSSGTKDVTNYASATVGAGSATTPATTVTATVTPTVNSTTGLVTATASGSKSVTPTVSAGYVSSGRAGTITVSGSGTLQLSTQAAKTVTPTESIQEAVAAGKYTTGAVTVGAIDSNYVGSDVTRRTSSDLTASGATVTAPAGYYASAASKSVASGSAKTPATTIESQPTMELNIETGVVTATNTKTQDITPTVTAGYVSSGTAGTVTVSGGNTLQIATKAGETVTPSMASQTVQTAGKYMTGNVVVNAIPSDMVKTYTATIIKGGYVSPASGAYVRYPRYNGQQYYSLGDSFSFTPGETLYIETYVGQGTCTIVIDGETVKTGDSFASYLYTLPAHPINISLSSGSNATITESKLTITTNDTHDVSDYSTVITNVHEGLVDITWSKIKQCVNEGLDPSFLPIGTQITDKWTWQGTTYDAPWNVVHYNSNGMYLQWEYATPEEIEFDAEEAFYYVGDEGLPAGEYYFTSAITSAVSSWPKKTNIQFTLAANCQPGDQFWVTGNTYSGDFISENKTMYVYPKGSKTYRTFCKLTEGTTGTFLGSTSTNQYKTNGNFNAISRAVYGNHQWSQSAVRQWLNSDAAAGEWWQPMNPWDRPPSYAANRPGFLSGYSEEFKSMLEPTAVVTALDTVSGFEQATETTYDKVFLSNAWQLYSSYSADLQDGEGESWDYWKQHAEDAGIQGMMNDTTEARNILKRYPINAQTSANAVWLRSPYSTSDGVRDVHSTGYIGSTDAYGSCRCCPVCIIKKSTPSYLVPSNLDWTAIKKMATLGTDSSLEVGTQIVDSWVRSDNGTSIDVPWDIVHYDDKNMVLQWHYTLPFNTIFDAQEAMYYVGENGLPAGTYYITTGSATGISTWNSKNIQFTLASACDPGDQFVISSPTKDPTASRTLTVYSYGGTVAKQTATTSSGTDGTLLGTMGDKGATNGNCNGVYWVANGNHRWSQSNLRTWLNSDSAAGEWFTPMNPWDRPPSYVNYPGFLYGCSESFKNAIAVGENKTLLDTVSGFTDTYETTYDRIYLPSLEELYTVPDAYGVEGEPWQYYIQQAKAEGYDGYLPQNATVANALRKKYRYDAQTSANIVWLRSPYYTSNSVRYVPSNGLINNLSAYNSCRCCPTCKISLVK